MAIKINGVTVIDDSRNWVGNSVIVPPAVSSCKICGLTSVSPNLNCANYYQLRINSPTFTVCNLTNETCCNSLFFEVYTNKNASIQFPSCFVPSFNAQKYDEGSVVYQYTRAGTCWILTSRTTPTFSNQGDNEKTGVKLCDYSSCASSQFFCTLSCCYSLAYAACGIPDCYFPQTIISAIPGRKQLISCADASVPRRTYNTGIFTIFCDVSLASTPIVLHMFNKLSAGDSKYRTTPVFYRLSQSGYIPLSSGCVCYLACHAVCGGAGDSVNTSAQIVTHSVACNIVAIHERDSSCCFSAVNVYRLSDLLNKRICILQTIQLNNPCCYVTGVCGYTHAVIPFHDLDKSCVPAKLMNATCLAKFWKGSASCPLCFRLSCSGINIPRAINGAMDPNTGIISISRDGQYILMSCRTNCYGLYTGETTWAYNASVLRDSNFNSCVCNSTYSNVLTILNTGFSCCSPVFGDQTQQEYYVDDNFCHIFWFGNGPCHLGVGYTRISDTCFVQSMPCAFGTNCFGCCSTTANPFFVQLPNIDCCYSFISCICVEKCCAYSALGCSVAQGCNKGFVYNPSTCTWSVGSTLWCCVMNDLCYNVSHYVPSYKDDDGKVRSIYSVNPLLDQSLFNV